jgi:hypothetical protein
MKTEYSFNDVPENFGMLEYLSKKQVLTDSHVIESVKNYTFNEFTLEELNLPPAQELLQSTLLIKKEVGLRGWKNKDIASQSYRGFSITYNPDFYDKTTSIHHQTWGSNLLTQSFGKINGLGDHSFIKNTYYDTYSFRKRPPSVEKHLGKFLDCFRFPVFRSRAAFLNLCLQKVNDNEGWHVDEPPTYLTRLNIPLQTSQEHVLEIKGQDEFGNSLNMTKHLEVGKAYIWNTRIPHRVTTTSTSFLDRDRIHLVIGLSPWLGYNPINDTMFKSEFFGMPLRDIISNKHFIKL